MPNQTLERMTTALTVFAKSGIAGAVVIRSAFVGAPECALGFRTVLLSLAESRRSLGDFGWRVFLRHASGHLAEL
jgi:hypothetical protein